MTEPTAPKTKKTGMALYGPPLAVLLLLVAGIAGWSALSGSPSGPASSDSGSAAAPADAHPTGGMKGTLEIDMVGARTVSSVGPDIAAEKAAEGGVLVVVYYTVKNTGNEPVHAFDVPDIHLLDSQGVQYSDDAGKTGILSLEEHFDIKGFSDLNPGITVRNAKVFEVSKAAFDRNTWSVVVDGIDQHFLVADIPSKTPW
jgi:hypothetical protein